MQKASNVTATIGYRFVRFNQMYFALTWLFPREVDG